MSSNDLLDFTLDVDGNVTAVYEYDEDDGWEQETIRANESYVTAGIYVVLIEARVGTYKWTIFEQDAETLLWSEAAEGYGEPDLTEIAAGNFTSGEDDEDEDDGEDGPGDDFYQFEFDESGTVVTAVFEVKDDGSLEDERISPNETYTIVGDYIVEMEDDDGGQEWTIFLLDSATGYYTRVAEGEGELDLSTLDTIVATYVPGDYERTDSDDDFNGGRDDDDFHGDDGDDGDDDYHGGRGTDRVIYTGATNTAVDLSKSGPQATGHGYDSFTAIEDIETDEGDDDLTGNGNDNWLNGNGGDDDLDGKGGDDDLDGGEGHDALKGGAGDDDLDGDNGNDKLNGNNGADTINGGSGRDKLNGGSDNDDLTGGAGRDRIRGGDGDDTLTGGAGDDVLDGEEGNDILTGGAGADVFVFHSGDGTDTITDFEIGIDLISIDADLAETFDDLVLSAAGTDTVIDYGGDTITLTNVDISTLTADNFVFN